MYTLSQRPVLVFVVTMLVLSFLSGCQSPSNAERQESFLANQQQLRCALPKVEKAAYHLIGVNTDFKWIRVDPASGKLSGEFSDDKNFFQALCVGIKESGYLLTAGHCVANYTYVLGDFEGKVGCQRARVVFRSSSTTAGNDFAILKVESPIHCLPYAADVAQDQVVFAIGFVASGEIGGGLDFAAGKVKDVRNDPFGNPSKLIDTTIPLRAGDSGGPIFNADGELVGITQGWQLEVHGLSGTYRRLSCRPDWVLLKQHIENDGRVQAPQSGSGVQTVPSTLK